MDPSSFYLLFKIYHVIGQTNKIKNLPCGTVVKYVFLCVAWLEVRNVDPSRGFDFEFPDNFGGSEISRPVDLICLCDLFGVVGYFFRVNRAVIG